MMAWQFLIDLANRVEEEMEWTVELEDRDTCKDLMETVEKFEKVSRKEKAARMKFVFQLNDSTDVLDQSGYEEEFERRQSKEKEKAAKRQVDIEMRSVEISVRGTKIKAFRKETPKEKASAGVKARKEACITPTINRVKVLSPPPNQGTI